MTKFDKILYIEIGKILKKARLQKNMSLQNVSDALGNKKTKQTIMRYENGTSRIEAETMKDLCRILGLDADTVIHTAQQRVVQNSIVDYNNKLVALQRDGYDSIENNEDLRLLAYYHRLTRQEKDAVMTMIQSMGKDE